VSEPLLQERGSSEKATDLPMSPEVARPPEQAMVAVPNVLLSAAAHERSAADVWKSMGSAPPAAPMSLLASPRGTEDERLKQAEAQPQLAPVPRSRGSAKKSTGYQIEAGQDAAHSPENLEWVAERGHNALGLARDTLLPAYHAAVDALDPAAAFELAAAIIDMMRGARRDIGDVAARLGLEAGDARAWEATVTEGSAPPPLDWEAQVRLAMDVELDRRELAELTGRLAYELGPRVFRGAVVSADPVPASQRSVEAGGAEAAVTIELLNTVLQVRQLMGSDQAGALSSRQTSSRGGAAARSTFCSSMPRSRRKDYSTCCGWSGGSQTGRNVFGLHEQVEESAKTFGTLLDVGGFELDEAVTLLSYYWDDWAITDEDAHKVIEMWASASAEARVVILDKLEAEGRLARLSPTFLGSRSWPWPTWPACGRTRPRT
jgi:hypothetical protein